jgi:hypothetical protein
MTRDEVIAALEAATGPDRELDAALFEYVGLTELQERHCRQWCSQNGRTDLTRAHYIRTWAPDYTASIDAAMTLVQEGSFLDLYGPDRTTGMYCAELPVVNSDAAFLGRSQVGLAIALCIAAVLARAA